MFGSGVLLGCVLTVLIFRLKSAGFLRVDTSDPNDNPYLFLELSKNIDAVCTKKYLVLRVKLESFVPHK